jgi:hypothetical protein
VGAHVQEPSGDAARPIEQPGTNLPAGFDRAEWEQAIRDGRVVVSDGPRSSHVPRPVGAILWFFGLTWRSVKFRLSRRFPSLVSSSTQPSDAEDFCPPGRQSGADRPVPLSSSEHLSDAAPPS